MNKILITRHIKIFEELAPSYPQLEFTFGAPQLPCQETLGVISLLSDPIDESFLDLYPNLKVVSNFAVGFNNIDLTAAQKKSISIGNTPDTLTHSTAEMALLLALMAARRTKQLQNKVAFNYWKRWEPEIDNGVDLRGKKMGIIGFGRIGQAFAEMAYNLWKAEILVWERKSYQSLSLNFPFQLVSPELFYQECELVSLHCPLTEETKEIINENFFQKMTNPFFLINTARGGCVNESDLLEALETNKCLGAGLDVTHPEPPVENSPLLNHPKICLLPHIGSATDRTRREMAIQCLENIVAGIAGKPLPYPVLVNLSK